MDITVITVCFNAEKTIERTFMSVISQNDKDFEYLIIDGKSKDNTVEIIKKWENKFIKSGIKFRWISEKDEGLYDAMNKAAQMSAGKWIIYLNADDEFNTEKTIELAKENLNDDIDVLYGNSIFVSKKGDLDKRLALPINTIKKHLPFIPQSAFIRRKVQMEYAFDLNYKITADYDSYLRMYLAKKTFKQVDFFFSKFYEGGVSNNNEWETYKEDVIVKDANGILNKNSIMQKVRNIRRWIKYKV